MKNKERKLILITINMKQLLKRGKHIWCGLCCKRRQSKLHLIIKLDDETCLIIVDWAMKFLPLKYRETVCEVFGKRGLGWHISAVVTKKDSRIEVECFVHIFSFCTQNNYAVASIFEKRKNVASQVKEWLQSQKFFRAVRVHVS